MPLRLFALGSNGAGQLGIGHRNDVLQAGQCMFEPPLTEGESITDIRAGGNHTLTLTSSGRAYATGNRAALPADIIGLNHFHLLDMCKAFGPMDTSKVTHIAASWNVSYFVVDNQAVYSCGTGNKGELGQGEGKAQATMLELAFDLCMYGDGSTKVHGLSAGLSHAALITSDGAVYGWGTSRKGELGQNAMNKKVVWSPQKIYVGFHANGVACGRNFTFIRGKGNEQLLLGNAKHLSGGGLLNLSTTTEVAAGWSGLYALDSGKLQAVGRNDKGQCPPSGLPALKHFAAGSEHAVGCTEDGNIIAFGWGEHGNCGEPIDETRNVAGQFNIIAIPKNDEESISLVAAGCATTLVAISSPTAIGKTEN